ncbi:MAG: mandelate racemase/muconate lactonizing enzyme family protein [Anaerolineae bacterium]
MTTISEQYINQGSRPSNLKITDMRVVNLKGVVRATLIRIDTNQGISGYGEVRDMASKTYALMLKSRILGENPCNVDKVFRKIKQFGHHARQAGGVCAIEMALMDLAGKAYGVPAYMLANGKFRDKILCYSDTHREPDGTTMGKRLKERMNQGFKFLKMDLGIYMLRNVPDTLIGFPDNIDSFHIMHPFTGTQITEKGIDWLCQYIADVRSIVGYEVPLAIDHFGHIGLESCIRLGQALDQFSLAWYEDMLPWQFTDQYVTLSRAVKTPICTGEDIYLKEGFMPLFKARAVSVIHPDLASSGGILETKKIGDLAQEHGIAMAMHMAGSPIAALAAVHCAAATENFLVLENHSVDHPEWNDFVVGLPNPLIQDGYIQVPETPGLGFTDVNEEMLRTQIDLDQPGYFEPTAEWDNEKSWDRLWS